MTQKDTLQYQASSSPYQPKRTLGSSKELSVKRRNIQSSPYDASGLAERQQVDTSRTVSLSQTQFKK